MTTNQPRPSSTHMTADAGVGVTARLAALAATLELTDVPDDAKRIARLALMDWYAVAWAGADEGPVALLRQLAEQDGGKPDAALIHTGLRVPAAQAALVNGAAGHVLDFDDVQNEIPGHATAPVAPAVLALAEAEGASGAELLAAFIAGFETACRMGRLLAPGHFKRGWQASTITGVIGAAAGCGRLLRLDQPQMTVALALAAMQASGMQAGFGGDTKSFSMGHTARAGLVAARLAQLGMGAASNMIEAPRGLAKLYAEHMDEAHAFAAPDGGWHLYRNLFKYHAACFMALSPLEALQQIAARRPITPETVETITARIEGDFHRVVLTPPPKSGLAAKFNLPFCLALFLAGHDTGNPAAFSDELTRDPGLHALAERCRIEIDPTVHFTAADMEVAFVDGGRERVYADVGEPDPDLDRVEARLRAKLATLTPELNETARDALADSFLAIETLPDLRRLHPEMNI